MGRVGLGIPASPTPVPTRFPSPHCLRLMPRSACIELAARFPPEPRLKLERCLFAKETLMNDELPFTRENRPWLTSDCIESMNVQFRDCLSHIPRQYRDALREWAAVRSRSEPGTTSPMSCSAVSIGVSSGYKGRSMRARSFDFRKNPRGRTSVSRQLPTINREALKNLPLR